MSSFYVYNTKRERIGMLQNESSVQWLESYQSAGEVKIDTYATKDNLNMLVEGNRIYNTDTNTAALICQVAIEQSEAEEIIVARAVMTSALLNERVVMATENVTNIEEGMYSLYRKNRRGLPINLDVLKGYSESKETEITWNSVLDALKTLAETSGLGFKVVFDPETGTETLTVYRGVDRASDSQTEYVGYFGTDVGNIQNVGITTGVSNHKNVAVVTGAGEGTNRVVRIVSLGNVQGENRRELYVDARDLQWEHQEAIPTGEYDEYGNPTYTYKTKKYTQAEYYALLDTRGIEKLAEHLRTLSISCDIGQNNIEYGKDYNLGDRMPVNLPEYGISTSAQVSSVTMIYDRGGKRAVALLSDFKLEGL